MGRRGFEQRRMAPAAKALKDHKHIALCLLYAGSAFRGLQLQTHGPTHHTIEGVILQAMKDVGIISEIERGRPKDELHFSRSCRTDRGVHAIRNVVGLFVRLEDFERVGGTAGIAAKLNAVLPPAIRVAKASVVMGSFIPRHCCTRRVYRYLLPAYALLPPCDCWQAVENAYPGWTFSLSSLVKRGVVGSHWDFPSEASALPSDSADAWIAALKQHVDRCNALLASYYCGANRFHNFSVDAANPAGFGSSKVVRPDSDDASRMIYRCQVAPRIYFLPSTRKGVSMGEYEDNLAVAPAPSGEEVHSPNATTEATAPLPTALPFLIFQVEGGSFLFNMIRKMVGSLLSVCRGASEAMLAEALSPERCVTTPLAPAPYLYLANSSYHGYDALVRGMRSKTLKPLLSEWSEAVASVCEEFASSVIAVDVVDIDLNRVPPLDDLLAARDRCRRIRRPMWEAEDAHLPNMKEYRPAVGGRARRTACSEMTVFLRLLRVHNWSVKPIRLPPNCKALLEVKNKKARQEKAEPLRQNPVVQDQCDAKSASPPQEEKPLGDADTVPNGGEDGWIYVAATESDAQQMRQAYFARRWKRSRPWEYSGSTEEADKQQQGKEEVGCE